MKVEKVLGMVMSFQRGINSNSEEESENIFMRCIIYVKL
jgi:hypothetical protein